MGGIVRVNSAVLISVAFVLLALCGTAFAAANSTVDLGTAGNFAILAGSGIVNTGSSIINGDIGSSPTGTISGFPPGTVNGTNHSNDSVTIEAKINLTSAYNDTANRTPTGFVVADLGGQTLTPGVYKDNGAPTSLSITGTLTLNGQGNSSSVFIFQSATTLTTASYSNVTLINGTQARNVFWQVGSSATLGTYSTFKGNILALTSITLTTGTNVEGRVLAQNGAVTLAASNVSVPNTTASCNCGHSFTAGETCTLTSNQSNSSTCFTVNAANVTINCNGYSITGTNAGSTYGVYSNQTNTTIKNCIIRDFTSAIYFYTATNGTIQNTTATSFDDAILFESSNYTTIANTTATATRYRAIKLNTYSYFNTIANTTATAASGYTILVQASSNNTITNTTATAIGEYAIYFDSSSNNTITNTTANATTNYAIKFSASSNNNIIANSTSTAGNFAIDISSSFGNTIINTLTIATSTKAISFSLSSSNNTITNTTANSAGNFAIIFTDSGNNTISNTTATASNYIFYVDSNSNRNTFANNTLRSSGATGILLYLNSGASGNTFYWNNFTDLGSPINYVSDANGSNFYNATVNSKNEGNIWGNVMNGSTHVYGTTLSGYGHGLYIGTNGSGYPYRNSTSAGKFACNFAGCQDNAPLTMQEIPGNLTVNYTSGGTATGSNSTFIPPANLTINATASTGYYFVNWTTNCNSSIANATNPNTQIQVDGIAACYVQANFAAVCRALSVAGATETLGQNITINGSTCFTVNASNVIIDCAGSSITGNNASGTIGISSNKFNTTIRNCQISNFSTGIYFYGSTNGTIRNSTVSTSRTSDSNMNGNGIYLDNANYTIITNSSATSATTNRDAIRLVSSSNNTISDSIASAGSYAISLASSSNFNTIANMTATATTQYAIILASCSNNTITNTTANANNSAISLASSSNFNTIANMTATATNQYAIILDSCSDNTIRDSTAISNNSAIHLISSFNNAITNNTATSNNTIIYIEGPMGSCSGNDSMCEFFSSDKLVCEMLDCTWASVAGNNNFTDNTVTGGTHGFYVSDIVGNTFVGNSIGNNSLDSVYLDSASSGNTFYWNNFTATSGAYVNDTNGSNYYNTTISGHSEGNIWANVMDGRVAITGTNNSTGFPSLRYGTNGSGYPYGNSTSEGMFSCNYAGCADYAPLTDPSIIPNVIGNGLSIDVSGSGLNTSVSIGGSSGDVNGTRQSGTKTVNITNSYTGQPLFVFDYNFTNSSLNFSGVRIEDGTSGGKAYASISGINSAQISASGKTIYMHNADTTINNVCVKDAEGAAYASISSTCTASDETIVTCDGAGHSGYTCAYNGTTAIITGLLHSAAIQFAPAAPAPSPSGGNNNGGGSVGGSSGASASAKQTATYNVDVGLGKTCAVTITREMASANSLSVLTTTLENIGGSGCSMTEFVFTDTIPSSFQALNVVTFNPMYATRDGWTVSFGFPSFAAGESKTLTYSANQWIKTSLSKNFTAYAMTAKKQQAAQPVANATAPAAVEPNVEAPRKLPASPSAQPAAQAAPSAAPAKQTDNNAGIIGTALMLGGIAAVAGAVFFFAWKGRKQKKGI